MASTLDPATRLGLAVDDDPLFAELIGSVRMAALEAGLDVRDVASGADAVDRDVVLLIGRPARYQHLVSGRAAAGPRPPGPRWISWSGEPLPVPTATAGRGRNEPAEAAVGRAPRRTPGLLGRIGRDLPLVGPPARWRERLMADRLERANLRELRWAAAHGIELVVTSRDRAAVLAADGLTGRVVPFGYDPQAAGPLTPPDEGPRDLVLVCLGATSRHLRRGELLARMTADRRGPTPVILDGVWGAERRAILRRARVMIDVHRVPGTFVGIRLTLALAAGVAVVTEPMRDAHPFRSGRTHLEVPGDALLATARELAADAARRRSLVLAGQALLTSELAMDEVLGRVIGSRPPIAATATPA